MEGRALAVGSLQVNHNADTHAPEGRRKVMFRMLHLTFDATAALELGVALAQAQLRF
jgi:hypothetical protein